MTEIQHVTDDDSHGPVAGFLTDDGRIAFVCRRDGAYWQQVMPQVVPPGQTVTSDGVGSVLGAAAKEEVEVAAAPEPLAKQLSMADA
jgi:hypothetical protein